MSKRSYFVQQADECRDSAERSKSPERQCRWLELASKWLKLAEEYTGDEQEVAERPSGFTPVVYDGGADRKAC